MDGTGPIHHLHDLEDFAEGGSGMIDNGFLGLADFAPPEPFDDR